MIVLCLFTRVTLCVAVLAQRATMPIFEIDIDWGSYTLNIERVCKHLYAIYTASGLQPSVIDLLER